MALAPDPRALDLLDAILPHVAFDGWSPDAFRAAAADAELSMDSARAACPRGATDLAALFHEQGDAAMVAILRQADLNAMRYSERVAYALRVRLDCIDDKEAVRRGTALFALPHLAPVGSGLIWGTADAIWDTLGDTSGDVNWYTKRATLSAVYASVVLYWLGDDSAEGRATTDFIDRRIDDVMQIEKVKAAVRGNPLTKPFASALGALTARIRPPAGPRDDLPGTWGRPE